MHAFIQSTRHADLEVHHHYCCYRFYMVISYHDFFTHASKTTQGKQYPFAQRSTIVTKSYDPSHTKNCHCAGFQFE